MKTNSSSSNRSNRSTVVPKPTGSADSDPSDLGLAVAETCRTVDPPI